MEQRARLLVVGAAKESLGRAVYEAARGTFDATTAGIHRGDETHYLDVTDPNTITDVVGRVAPEHIICTAGVNDETDMAEKPHDLTWHMERLFRVNSVGPMALYAAWRKTLRLQGDALLPGPKHFVAISSNSAHIARSTSAAYCMTKAALSMGIRCAAREGAGEGRVVYGYEPGWLEGTPMSVAVTRRLQPEGLAGIFDSRPLHRIPGGQGVDPYRLARHIVHNLQHGGPELNGALIRIDGGEQ